MNVQLNYVNASLGTDIDVVVFQQGFTSNPNDPVFPWIVIKHCGRNCYHPFEYGPATYLSIGDEYGNYSSLKEVMPGQTWAVEATHNGRRLNMIGDQRHSRELQVQNDRPSGAINVCLFRNKRIVARKTAVAPRQMAVFDMSVQTIWFAAASDVKMDQPLPKFIVSEAREFALPGIASADIVMGGGGAEPYCFTLENVMPV
ncbi:MAG: hypothetical protein RLY71_3425 [Pseudomonadota bacterium]|jgi:hypothetical protein